MPRVPCITMAVSSLEEDMDMAGPTRVAAPFTPSRGLLRPGGFPWRQAILGLPMLLILLTLLLLSALAGASRGKRRGWEDYGEM